MKVISLRFTFFEVVFSGLREFECTPLIGGDLLLRLPMLYYEFGLLETVIVCG